MVEVFQWVRDPADIHEDSIHRLYKIMRGDIAVVTASIGARDALAATGLRLEKVAEVDGFDKGRAFHLTNHIDHDWTTNPGLKVVGEANKRSTSVGDVMRCGKEAFVVSSVGFTALDTGVDLGPIPGASTNKQRP